MAAPPSQAPPPPGLQTPDLQTPVPFPEGSHLLSTHRCRDSLDTAVGGIWVKDFGVRDNMWYKPS